MRPHLVNLLADSWRGVLAALSTSTLAVVLFSLAAPVATFFVTLIVVSKIDAGKTFLEHLKQSVIPTLIGFAVPLVLVSLVLGWKVVGTVYSDHQILVAEAKSLRAKTAGLVDPKSKDDEITDLKKQIDAYRKQESPAVRIYPIGHDLRPGVPKLEYVMTTRKIRAPVEILATCDFPIASGSAKFLTLTGGSAETTNDQRISDKQYRFVILSPDWSPSAPLWLTIFFGGTVDRMPSCSFQVS
jgi:hypothetical protein